MPKKKKPVKYLYVVVMYNYKTVDFEIYEDVYDAEVKKHEMELEKYACSILKKIVR